MMNLWGQLQRSKMKYVLIGILFILLICGIKYDITRVEKNELRKEEEISRIEDYFKNDFEIYKIPSWIERSPINTKVFKLQKYIYLLQTEEDKKRTILSGVPYWPFASRKEAVRYYAKLPEEERDWYMVISQSLVYIAYATEEERILLKEAAEYFNKQYGCLD